MNSINKLSATITRITANDHVSVGETQKLSPAILKELAESSDGQAVLKKAVENLEALAAALNAGTISSDDRRPNRRRDDEFAGARGVNYLLANLTESHDALNAQGAEIFDIAFGLAYRGGKVTVDEGRDLKKVAERLIAESSDPAATIEAIRQAIGKFEAGKFSSPYNQRTPDDYMSGSAQQQMDRLHRMLGNAVLDNLDDVAPGTIDPSTSGMKVITEVFEGGNDWLAFEMPQRMEQELATFDSRGLAGPAKLKMEEAAVSHAKALGDYLADKYPSKESHVNLAKMYAWGMTTGHMYAPGARDVFKAELASQDTSVLEGTKEQYQSLLEQLGEPHSSATEKLEAAYKEALKLAKAELRTR